MASLIYKINPGQKSWFKKIFPGSRKNFFKWVGCLVIVVLILLAVFIFDPGKSVLFPPCPFHTVTGYHCPGCGSLRSLHQLFHGNLRAAFELNPLMIISIPFLIYGFISEFMRIFLDRPLAGTSLSALWIRIILGVIIAFWILRNIPYYPFTVLAP